MSVKKINNKQVVSRGAVNRGDQKSFREETGRLGNRSQSIIPGKDYTKNYSITLKDIDTTVLSHMKEIIKPTVKEANEIIQVPVLWANEERWKMVRKNGVLRDKNNSIILPLIG
jgi:glutaredoxin